MNRLTRLALAPLALASLTLAACGDDDTATDAADMGAAADAGETAGDDNAAPGDDAGEAGVRVVSPAEAATLLAADPAPTLIDVRTPGEYAEGHLADAVLIDYNAPDFEERIAELDPDQPYVIYCRSGNRSAGARAVMTDLGFVDVADIDGGIVAWIDAGLPVVTG